MAEKKKRTDREEISADETRPSSFSLYMCGSSLLKQCEALLEEAQKMKIFFVVVEAKKIFVLVPSRKRRKIFSVQKTTHRARASSECDADLNDDDANVM